MILDTYIDQVFSYGFVEGKAFLQQSHKKRLDQYMYQVSIYLKNVKCDKVMSGGYGRQCLFFSVSVAQCTHVIYRKFMQTRWKECIVEYMDCMLHEKIRVLCSNSRENIMGLYHNIKHYLGVWLIGVGWLSHKQCNIL